MELIGEIVKYWGWTGVEPEDIVDENDFGNLIIKDVDGRYWRLCPEDVYCAVIADNITEYQELTNDPEFQMDWEMRTLVEQATNKFGPLGSGYKFYMVIPGVLGGEYGIGNIKTLSLIELIRLSGDIGRQIKDLPDGARVKLQVVK